MAGSSAASRFATPELAEIPVIVVSAAGRDRIAEIDANAYLTKPVDLEQLLERVSHYCCQ